MCAQGAETGPPLAVCCWGLAWGAVSLISRKGRNSELHHLPSSRPWPPCLHGELGFSLEAPLPSWDSDSPCALQVGGLGRLEMPTSASTCLSDQALAILKSQWAIPATLLLHGGLARLPTHPQPGDPAATVTKVASVGHSILCREV